jgi:hypothetical protein
MARQRHALLLTAREAGRRTALERKQFDRIQRLIDPPIDFVAAVTPILGNAKRKRHVLKNGHVRPDRI